MDELIESAIRGNPDLKQSVLRVVQARAMVVAARASGLPSLSGTGSYTREQIGARGLLESEGIYTQVNKIADPAVKKCRRWGVKRDRGAGQPLEVRIGCELGDRSVRPYPAYGGAG